MPVVNILYHICACCQYLVTKLVQSIIKRLKKKDGRPSLHTSKYRLEFFSVRAETHLR